MKTAYDIENAKVPHVNDNMHYYYPPEIEYQFSSLRGGYTFQANHAKSRETEMNIYTTKDYSFTLLAKRRVRFLVPRCKLNSNVSKKMNIYSIKISPTFLLKPFKQRINWREEHKTQIKGIFHK